MSPMLGMRKNHAFSYSVQAWLIAAKSGTPEQESAWV